MANWKEILQLYLSGVAKWKNENEFWIDEEITIEIVDIGKKMWIERGWCKGKQKWWEINYKNGKRHGVGVWWHENGQKEIEVSWENGELCGVDIWCYENGQKEIEVNWENGESISEKLF